MRRKRKCRSKYRQSARKDEKWYMPVVASGHEEPVGPRNKEAAGALIRREGKGDNTTQIMKERTNKRKIIHVSNEIRPKGNSLWSPLERRDR